MKHLRLIADDLTGALDTAAQFAGAGRSIPVYLNGTMPGPEAGDLAVDAATRDTSAKAATEAAARLAPFLAPDRATLAYKKVDSRLRGHPGLELATVIREGKFPYCIIAAAFPVHGRVTRGGRQVLLSENAALPVGEDIAGVLRSQGLAVSLKRPGESVPEGISVWDAESDLELALIAKAGVALEKPVLWCGSGGLAAALAGPRDRGRFLLERPILGILGSDHPVTVAQLAACGQGVLMTRDGFSDAPRVATRLLGEGACLVGFDIPKATSRPEAANLIAAAVRGLLGGIPRPATLVVSGGETTRAVCMAVSARHLLVEGEVSPGIPVSRIVGGVWDSVRVVSKSGAFGDEMLLLRLTEVLG